MLKRFAYGAAGVLALVAALQIWACSSDGGPTAPSAGGTITGTAAWSYFTWAVTTDGLIYQTHQFGGTPTDQYWFERMQTPDVAGRVVGISAARAGATEEYYLYVIEDNGRVHRFLSGDDGGWTLDQVVGDSPPNP